MIKTAKRKILDIQTYHSLSSIGGQYLISVQTMYAASISLFRSCIVNKHWCNTPSTIYYYVINSHLYYLVCTNFIYIHGTINNLSITYQVT